MGFFDTMKKGMNAVNSFNEEGARYREKYAHLSKEELERKFKSASSLAEKAGIAQVMKEKGYR